MSTDLLWSILKNNNCYLVKRGGVDFSRDPLSQNNRNTFTGLGITKEHAAGLTATSKRFVNQLTYTTGPKFVHSPAKHRVVKLIKSNSYALTASALKKKFTKSSKNQSFQKVNNLIFLRCLFV
ncbi:hypothetical protein DSO57_1009581 [Entomophthora muscae]|uniref:Uncharacterized protein n=1 Tax=Entomophthora muscae TaxID=34485 RepID=A0ACC2TUC8_9FUNG|nr:hypothetical protein DSO57_1009581 [Entomophthora muscae]